MDIHYWGPPQLYSHPRSIDPRSHFPLLAVPSPNTAIPHIILIIVLRPALHHRFSEGNIDPSLVTLSALSLRYTMQPICLRPSLHKYHVSTSQWQFQRLLVLKYRSRLFRRWWNRLMFQEKVALCAQGNRSDCGLGAKEALVVAVI